MYTILDNVLGADNLGQARQYLADADFQDGRATAGSRASRVKNNLQLDEDTHRDFIDRISHAILNNGAFRRTVNPRSMKRVLISRYQDAMAYGLHVDNAVMGELRTDVSFTLFLNDPEEYTGGELEILDGSGGRQVKLAAGSMVIYPSGALHRVRPVTEGYRDAAVGWAQSFVRDPRQREILADIQALREALIAEGASDERINWLLKTETNLQRLWCEQ